jgi:hypothetical protein
MKRTTRVTGIAAFAMCDDGKIRKVQLGGQQPKQLHRYLNQLSGGQIKLSFESCRIVRGRPSLADRWRAVVTWLKRPRLTKESRKRFQARLDRGENPSLSL